MNMEPGQLKKVSALAEKVKTIYVATANGKGVPHIAVSKGATFLNEDEIVFGAWFCVKTVENLQENPLLSLAMIDPETHEGYQLLGEVNRIEKGAILDGYSPEMEKKWAGFPQAEHRLSIRIKEISLLTSGPHSDEFIR
jgi:hypothetical protein